MYGIQAYGCEPFALLVLVLGDECARSLRLVVVVV